jgi:hypothetical protein
MRFARLARVVAAVGLAAPLLAVQPRPGAASVPDALLAAWQCDGSGLLSISRTTSGYAWSMSGTGSCGYSTTSSLATGSEVTSSLSFALSGGSASLGLCSRGLLQGLNLHGTASGVAFDFGTVTGGDPFPTSGPWSEPLHFAVGDATFPVVTHFWVYDRAGAVVGDGTIHPSQLGLCPPRAGQKASISWSQPSPVGPGV